MANEKILTPAEVVHLQDLVQDLLNVINFDDTGVTDDLAEKAEVAAEILGLDLNKKPQVGDEEWDGD